MRLDSTTKTQLSNAIDGIEVCRQCYQSSNMLECVLLGGFLRGQQDDGSGLWMLGAWGHPRDTDGESEEEQGGRSRGCQKEKAQEED